MTTTEIPPLPESQRAPEPEVEVYPVLLVQLQDELANARLREAAWISLVVHLLLIIALATFAAAQAGSIKLGGAVDQGQGTDLHRSACGQAASREETRYR